MKKYIINELSLYIKKMGEIKIKFLQTVNDIPIKIIEIDGIGYNDAMQMRKRLDKKYGYKHTFLPEIMANRNYYNLNIINLTEEMI